MENLQIYEKRTGIQLKKGKKYKCMHLTKWGIKNTFHGARIKRHIFLKDNQLNKKKENNMTIVSGCQMKYRLLS